ncbi:MAG TPA: hypothetical protein VNH82_04760 [Candidatus Dormibacteraeota bacterium]|nr:hypothetical protein [Candidatus Dormibacteraeota bacterium]
MAATMTAEAVRVDRSEVRSWVRMAREAREIAGALEWADPLDFSEAQIDLARDLQLLLRRYAIDSFLRRMVADHPPAKVRPSLQLEAVEIRRLMPDVRRGGDASHVLRRGGLVAPA